MNSDTPRTDAELKKPELDTGIYNGLSDLTRQLERELAALQNENAALQADKNRLLEAAELGLEYIGGSLVQEKISLAFKAAIEAAKGGAQ